MTRVPLFLTPDWRAPARVRALCTLRGGGASRGPYRSLNLGRHVGDAPAAVDENHRRVAAAARWPLPPRWLRQVHGADVVDLDDPALPAEPVADAAVTTTAGQPCAVLTADCLPVLYAALDGSAVAAAHAGWRGLAAGVLQATAALVTARATPGVPVIAWLGPAIGPANFEVGDEVRAAFVAGDAGAAAAFLANARGRWQCDLYALARRALRGAGIAEVTGGEHCTFAATDRFFSHRRDAKGGVQTGRMATVVWLQP